MSEHESNEVEFEATEDKPQEEQNPLKGLSHPLMIFGMLLDGQIGKNESASMQDKIALFACARDITSQAFAIVTSIMAQLPEAHDKPPWAVGTGATHKIASLMAQQMLGQKPKEDEAEKEAEAEDE